MFSHTAIVSGIPTSGLDMTADLAPLLIGTWVILALCVLGIAVAIGLYDQQAAKTKNEQSAIADAAFAKAA